MDLRADNKIRGFQSFVEGAIERRLKNVAKILKDYPHEIKRSDAWELIAKEAKPGDLVIFDPDYIAEKGRKVSGYKVIEEDKSLKIFLKKFDAVVLPKSKSGVRFIITNTWNDDLAKALEERGFYVYKTKRRSAKGIKEELVATNFDREGKTVHPIYASSDARRRLEEAGQRLQKERREREGIIEYAAQSQREVEGVGRPRLSDEIRSRQRRIETEELTKEDFDKALEEIKKISPSLEKQKN